MWSFLFFLFILLLLSTPYVESVKVISFFFLHTYNPPLSQAPERKFLLLIFVKCILP